MFHLPHLSDQENSPTDIVSYDANISISVSKDGLAVAAGLTVDMRIADAA